MVREILKLGPTNLSWVISNRKNRDIHLRKCKLRVRHLILNQLGLVITRCVWDEGTTCAYGIGWSKISDIHVIKKKVNFGQRQAFGYF